MMVSPPDAAQPLIFCGELRRAQDRYGWTGDRGDVDREPRDSSSESQPYHRQRSKLLTNARRALSCGATEAPMKRLALLCGLGVVFHRGGGSLSRYPPMGSARLRPPLFCSDAANPIPAGATTFQTQRERLSKASTSSKTWDLHFLGTASCIPTRCGVVSVRCPAWQG
eukprot:scaffold1484_cov241-Pinguiococcus_pyrenoidosus.AAC.33